MMSLWYEHYLEYLVSIFSHERFNSEAVPRQQRILSSASGLVLQLPCVIVCVCVCVCVRERERER